MDEVSAQHFKADAVVHFGHSCLSSTMRLPSLLVLDRNPIDVEDFVTKIQTEYSTSDKLLIMYDVEYFHALGMLIVTYCNPACVKVHILHCNFCLQLLV